MGNAKRWFFANLSAGRGEKIVRFLKGCYSGRRREGLKKKGGFFSIIGDLHYFPRLEWVMMATHDNDMITFFLCCMSTNYTYKYTSINHYERSYWNNFLSLIFTYCGNRWTTILHNVNATSWKIFRLEMYWTKSSNEMKCMKWGTSCTTKDRQKAYVQFCLM